MQNVRSIFELLQRDIIHTNNAAMFRRCHPPELQAESSLCHELGDKCRQGHCSAARLGADVRVVNADLWAPIGPFHRLTVMMTSSLCI